MLRNVGKLEIRWNDCSSFEYEIHEKNLKILIGNNSKEELNNFNASSKY